MEAARGDRIIRAAHAAYANPAVCIDELIIRVQTKDICILINQLMMIYCSWVFQFCIVSVCISRCVYTHGTDIRGMFCKFQRAE
jgi:hypothetical protein